MKERFPDILGLVIALVCAVHCTALPILIAFLGKNSGDSHLYFDIAMLLLASIILIYTVKQKTTKSDFKLMSFLIGAGIVCYILSFMIESHLSHFFFASGSIFWLFLHIRNLRSLKIA